MNQLEIFKNREFGEIRTVVINAEPWFVGKDIAEVLGYSNSRKAILDHVDDEDKIDGVTIRDSIGRDQAAVVINESGLYALIFGSKMASAKRFKHWVTSEVLPQIRKNGSYQKRLTPEEMMRIQLGMVDDHENRIEHLENTMTIDYGRQQELKKSVNKRVIEVLGGKKAPVYKEMSKRYLQSVIVTFRIILESTPETIFLYYSLRLQSVMLMHGIRAIIQFLR